MFSRLVKELTEKGTSIVSSTTSSSENIDIVDSYDAPDPEPTPEERMAELETTTEDMILLMAELIGGN